MFEFPGVEATPGVCGGKPCIAGTRIPVWMLEQLRRYGRSQADLLEGYPFLKPEDLANAWAFVEQHRELIDEQIRQHDVIFAEMTSDAQELKPGY